MSAEFSYYALPTDPTDKLLAYPYAQPDVDYFTDGEVMIELPKSYDDFVATADEILAAAHLPLMADRIPLVSYGANANPVRFAEKMSKYGRPTPQKALQSAPFQRAVIEGADVVWHGKQGQSGSIFAELYNGPLVAEDVESPVFLSWVTPQQLAVMHTSEGITYRLTEVPVKAGSDAKELTAYAYTAGISSILLKDGKPVGVNRPRADKPGNMTARQAVSYLLAEAHASDVPSLPKATTPEELVAEMKGKPNLDAKKAAQAAVQLALQDRGANVRFSYQAAPEAQIGRADFNFTRGYHELHLMEETVSPLDSPELTTAVRHRAHNEIKERLENHG